MKVSNKVLGVIDQGLSSASNLLLAILVARSSTVPQFAQFSVAVIVYLLCMVVSRGLVGDLAVLLGKDSLLKEIRDDRGSLLGATLVIATVMAVLVGIAGIFLGGATLALAALLPILLFQDTCRLTAFALHRPSIGVVNDASWLAVFSAGAAVAIWSNLDDSIVLLSIWGLSSVPGTLFAGRRLGLLTLRPRFTTWLTRHSDRGKPLALDGFLSSMNQYLGILLLGVVSEPSIVASLRGSQVLLAPLNTLSAGLALVLTPRAVRIHQSRSSERSGLWSGFAVLSLVAVIWGVVLALVPRSVGQALLGASWDEVGASIALVSAALAASFAAFPVVTTLKVMRYETAAARTRLFLVPLSPTLLIVGAEVAGARGAAGGMLIAAVISLIIFGTVLWRCTAAQDQ